MIKYIATIFLFILPLYLIKKKFLRIGLEAGFSSIVGSQEYLRSQYKMDSLSIANRIKKLF